MTELYCFHDYLAKIIILGSAAVGKSTLLSRILDGTFNRHQNLTIGIDFRAKTLESKSGEYYRLCLWDTSGQEQFRSIARSYYRDCQGCLLVFDTTNRASLYNLNEILGDIQSMIDLPGEQILLIGTKTDLSSREVTADEAQEFLAKHKLGGYIETSAKTGQNIEKVLPTMTELLEDGVKNGKIKLPTSQYAGSVKMTQGGWNQTNCCTIL